MISIGSSRLARLLGKVENTERFAALALFQGRAKVGAAMIGSGLKITDEDDPTLFCAAFKKSRARLAPRRRDDGCAAAAAGGRRRCCGRAAAAEVRTPSRVAAQASFYSRGASPRTPTAKGRQAPVNERKRAHVHFCRKSTI